MSNKKRRARRMLLDAATLVEADDELTTLHAELASDGYSLAADARGYRCRNGSLTLQLTWKRKRPGRSSTYTMAIRGF